jgi:hypothetical protein
MATRNLTDAFAVLRAKNSRGPSEPRGRTASGRGLLEDVPLSNTREVAMNPIGEVIFFSFLLAKATVSFSNPWVNLTLKYLAGLFQNGQPIFVAKGGANPTTVVNMLPPAWVDTVDQVRMSVWCFSVGFLFRFRCWLCQAHYFFNAG